MSTTPFRAGGALTDDRAAIFVERQPRGQQRRQGIARALV
jgi:hypothetical protein